MSGQDREESRVDPMRPITIEAIHTGDARAQLWARVYATEYAVLRAYSHEQHQPPSARLAARREADAAVRDFDEHYLGGKR